MRRRFRIPALALALLLSLCAAPVPAAADGTDHFARCGIPVAQTPPETLAAKFTAFCGDDPARSIAENGSLTVERCTVAPSAQAGYKDVTLTVAFHAFCIQDGGVYYNYVLWSNGYYDYETGTKLRRTDTNGRVGLEEEVTFERNGAPVTVRCRLSNDWEQVVGRHYDAYPYDYISVMTCRQTAVFTVPEDYDGLVFGLYDRTAPPTVGEAAAEEAPTASPDGAHWQYFRFGRPSVVRTNQALSVNGEARATEIYNIDGSNFFKLRDIALLLNGTGAQFSVGYDEAARRVTAARGAPYLAEGGELDLGTDKSASAALSTQGLSVDGAEVDAIAYNIGGNNFFKLRDLAAALGFSVGYDAATRTILITSE
jgi:hypothetical protein